MVALAAQILISISQSGVFKARSRGWNWVAFACAVITVVLAVCPESPADHNSTTAHILTVALGAVVVFLAMGFRLHFPEAGAALEDSQ